MFKRNAVMVGYNIQAGADTKYKLHVVDIKEFDTFVDAGYHSGRELKTCKEDGTTRQNKILADMSSTAPVINYL